MRKMRKHNRNSFLIIIFNLFILNLIIIFFFFLINILIFKKFRKRVAQIRIILYLLYKFVYKAQTNMQSNDTFLRSMAQPYAGPFSWRVQDFRCIPLYLSMYYVRKRLSVQAPRMKKAEGRNTEHDATSPTDHRDSEPHSHRPTRSYLRCCNLSPPLSFFLFDPFFFFFIIQNRYYSSTTETRS